MEEMMEETVSWHKRSTFQFQIWRQLNVEKSVSASVSFTPGLNYVTVSVEISIPHNQGSSPVESVIGHAKEMGQRFVADLIDSTFTPQEDCVTRIMEEIMEETVSWAKRSTFQIWRQPNAEKSVATSVTNTPGLNYVTVSVEMTIPHDQGEWRMESVIRHAKEMRHRHVAALITLTSTPQEDCVMRIM